MRVAVRRAAHQLLDHPTVFTDPLALAIVGREPASEEHNAYSRAMRAFIAVRSRFAEDELAAAIERGTRQYVVLGAGLDTFAYRNPYPDLSVFEVDHPATQAWKHEQLTAAGIDVPPQLTFVPIDFERHTLPNGLMETGFDTGVKTFFSWLGVTPYLTREAFEATLKFVASLPSGCAIAFDFSVARSALNLRERLALDFLASRVAAAGEPFQLFFHPNELIDELKQSGFSHVDHLTPAEINSRYFSNRADGLRITGGLAHLICAHTPDHPEGSPAGMPSVGP